MTAVLSKSDSCGSDAAAEKSLHRLVAYVLCGGKALKEVNINFEFYSFAYVETGPRALRQNCDRFKPS